MNKEKTNKVLDYFEELFPDAHCELNHQNVFELLVAVMLSAQTTDKKVNQVTASLFKKYPTVESFALASLEDLQNDIKIIGLYRNKAKNLKKMAQVLLEEYNGEVPKTRKELESLPGVGRKTTNVVLSVGFDEPAFAVDTHVERISKRLGFAKKDIVIIEDSPKGIQAGVAAGVRVLAIRDKVFGADQSKADVLIDNLTEVLQFVENEKHNSSI